VNDGSTVSYDSVEKLYPEVRWLNVHNGGPGVARNAAVGQALGTYVAFTDDDCYLHPDWLKELRKTFQVHPSAIVGGSTPPHPDTNFYDQVSQFITAIVYRYYNRRPEQAEFFASNNLAIRRELFLELGGFPSCHTKNAAEDRSLCNLALSKGGRLVWNREAIVYHRPELTFGKFCKMYFRYGRGAYTYQKSRTSGTFVGEMSFHANLPAAVWRGLSEDRTLPVLPTLYLLSVWQVCNLAGFLWQTVKGDEF
jgi:GT2 family glycosyltransferase